MSVIRAQPAIIMNKALSTIAEEEKNITLGLLEFGGLTTSNVQHQSLQLSSSTLTKKHSLLSESIHTSEHFFSFTVV